MADDGWTIRTPERASNRKAIAAGLAVVAMLLLVAMFMVRPQRDAAPVAPQTVRESAPPTLGVKADHPSADLVARTTTLATPVPRDTPVDLALGDPFSPGHWKKAIDLLALIDPTKETVQNTWTRKDNTLSSDGGGLVRIGIPVKPPEEYDLKVTFTRTGGNEAVILVLGRLDRSFAWLLGGWNNTLFGFEMIGGRRANENPSTVKREPALQNGKTYTAILRVRRDRLQAYLDSELLTDIPMNFNEMSQADYWRLKDQQGFGLGSHESPTQFHSAVLLDVTRPGGQAPVPIATPAPEAQAIQNPGDSEF